MILPKITFENLDIPQINMSNHKYLRIEIGNSINSKREEISKKIKLRYEKLSIIKQLSKISYWKKYVKKYTVLDYLIEHEIEKSDIDKFFNYVLKAKEKLSPNDKIKDICEQQKIVIDIFILASKKNKILIETSGMYATVLHLTYLIIKKFIVENGYCVEIAYPHFGSTDELGTLVSEKIRVIKLGECFV